MPDGSEIFTELLHPSLDGPSDGSSQVRVSSEVVRGCPLMKLRTLQFFVYDTDGRVREFGVADHPDSDVGNLDGC